MPRALSPIHPVTAFLASLLLLLPTYGALGTTSDGGLWLWFTGGIAAVALLGVLLRLVLPRALALVLLAASAYLVVVLAGIFVVAAAGPPAGNATLALLVGIPAAAVAALVAAALTEHFAEDAMAPAVVAIVILGLIGISVAPAAGDAVADARDRAERIADLEASGLTPYLPEIPGLSAGSGSTSLQGERIVGYSFRYERDPDDYRSPALSVEVDGELPTYRDCDTSERAIYQCRRGEGYYVLAQDGADQYVVAESGGDYLIGWYLDQDDRLPDADTVGKALAGAERVEWSDVVGVD